MSHGVVRTVFQSTLLPFSSLTSFPTSHGDLSFASIRVPPFDSWMVPCAGGVAISSDGLLALPMLLFSSNWGGWTLCPCTERLLSLFKRALSMPCGERCPLPALIFRTALSFPGSWASHCVSLCNSLGVPHPNVCGIGLLSAAHFVQAWFQTPREANPGGQKTVHQVQNAPQQQQDRSPRD